MSFHLNTHFHHPMEQGLASFEHMFEPNYLVGCRAGSGVAKQVTATFLLRPITKLLAKFIQLIPLQTVRSLNITWPLKKCECIF